MLKWRIKWVENLWRWFALDSVIYLPEEDLMCYAQKGKGAFCNGERMNVSGGAVVTKEKVWCSSRSVLMKRGYTHNKSTGYAAVHLALGNFDGLDKVLTKSPPFEGPALYLLVTEAGGRVTAVDGSVWGEEMKEFVASNGKVHEELVTLVISFS